MSDAEARDADLDALLATFNRRGPGNRCLVAVALMDMPEATRSRVVDILDNHPLVPSSQLANTLQEWGHEVPYQSIVRHRRRGKGVTGCACP